MRLIISNKQGFPSKESVEETLRQHSSVWETYSNFPDTLKQELIGFCTGKNGLKITYDPIFQKIFNPYLRPKRLEAFLSAILGRTVRIIRVISREGIRLSERASFVVMDILIQLDDGSYANVEMQKIGYNFPLARADCYASDIIMRQYAQVKAEQGISFSFQNLHKVYCIILMEKSPREFHTAKGKYIHRRISSFDKKIYTKSSGLQIASLLEAFPCFAPIYQKITDFTNNPEELINMLSEELYIMDKNMERMMVTELQQEVDTLKAEADTAKAAKAATEERLQQVLAYAIAHGYKN